MWFSGKLRRALALIWWRAVSRPSSTVPLLWHRRPSLASGDRLCLFVALARAGGVSPHSLYHARAWKAAGYRVLLIVVADQPELITDGPELRFADGMVVRANRGYDFGAWASAIVELAPDLPRLAMLATANDSLFGPFDAFPAMLVRAEATDADVIGVTESHELTHHFQSFILFFKPGALRSRAFLRFWRGVRTGPRAFVIHRYELRLRARMRAAGLRCAVLFPRVGDERTNPTLHRWRELVRAGFPFVKVQLLRDNPAGADLSGWDRELRQRGYDPALVRDLIGEVGGPARD